MADASSDLDRQVLDALATWEDSATGHDDLSVEQLTERLNLPAIEAGRVARVVKRLVDAGQLDALNLTVMGSQYPQYLITGLTAIGLQAARALRKATQSTPQVGPPEPTFMGVRRVDIRKNSRQVFVAYPYSIPADEYRQAFRDVGIRFGIEFVYADQRITNLHVLAKIYSMILESAFGIYDVSGWNANVTLELGIAFGMGETSYIVMNPTSHDSKEAPADIRGFDRIEYRTLDELRERLDQLLRGLGLRPK